MTQKLVIIGAGMSSGRMLEELFELAPDTYDVTLFGAEPRGNYNRIMLSPVLAGEKCYDDIVTHDVKWYRDHDVNCRFGEAVVKIDRARKQVFSANGVTSYDKLVIATGSASFFIPVAGNDLPGVVGFRDLDDVTAMLTAAQTPAGKAVVIGGGLLGLEAAAALNEQGMQVTVLHLMGHLMDRQLDPAAGYLLQQELQSRGIQVVCKAHTKAILGTDQVEAVLMEDGIVHGADLVVMAAGIRPEVRLANDAGLHVERGIVVDDTLLTSDPDVFALGECVEHDRTVYGLVAPLFDMAKVLAQTLMGRPAGFIAPAVSTKLKVTGVDLFSVGDFAEGPEREEIVFRDPGRGIYKRIILRDNQIIGTVMYGDTADSSWLFSKLKSGEDISDIRDTLIFGPSFPGGAPTDPLATIAALPEDAEICGCNGICKGTIVGAIQDGATDLAALKATTKASASCGSCSGLVEQVLASTLGDTFVMPVSQPICGCTDMTHEDLRRIIISQQIKTMPGVMQECGWKTSCGCHSCRPALNYYLLAEWPLDYADDAQSRFVNERNHANIQKDGTYSVLPRMWGGMTTPDELRAIADAADKYDVPAVKVTGGQRIDLLGVKKEDLPHMWADLNEAGMVSGHAYSKGLRTVKTCVGTDFCRFGTQDSTGLGIKLEKLLWGSWTPHKVKLAVSGCPRNCAEATCKDLGIICVDSGFEISVGGAAGMELKQTEALAKVATEQEAIELTMAFIQLYREHARYLDRAYKWVAKVGLDWVKERVVEDLAERAALCDRFELSQSVYRKDPWAEQATPAFQRDKWSALADLTLEAAE
ncbi:nitrite reductase large subunit NirB [Parasedimentitalea maritima]|uniref:Nitrite reductase large subunit n=1 Tax=Parasedimentitalea maritima TaxID=2578117 RepID=A0A6A4RET2_9RHOB|nr:nitrite reductase large subunit NirB [Zongyanglinia marina]KAE9629246.1 nitrite reductase large subunit [Zongyanglinia marina]